MKVTGDPTAAGTYFAHFMNTGTFFCARVFSANIDATTFKVGINSTSATPTFWATPLVKGVYYTIAIKYDAATGVSTMWVDPQSEASTSIVGPNTTVGTLVSGFALRQSAGTGVVYVDNIKVGDAFADLCPVATPTSSSTWGKLKALYR
jgi:hypothetical protein